MKHIILFVLMFSVNTCYAGVIKSVDAVIQNPMGEFSGIFGVSHMLNQDGLSSNYVSGVTDFNTFTISGVTHFGGDLASWLSNGATSGFLVFDLGAEFDVTNFVMWNGAKDIDASVNGFSLTTSLLSDFSVSTLVGNFSGQQSNYGSTVYDMTDSVARYVRMDISGNFGNSCCTAIGDIAFDVTPSAVPAPAAVWLFSSGLIGLIGMRKKSEKLFVHSA